MLGLGAVRRIDRAVIQFDRLRVLRNGNQLPVCHGAQRPVPFAIAFEPQIQRVETSATARSPATAQPAAISPSVTSVFGGTVIFWPSSSRCQLAVEVERSARSTRIPGWPWPCRPPASAHGHASRSTTAGCAAPPASVRSTSAPWSSRRRATHCACAIRTPGFDSGAFTESRYQSTALGICFAGGLIGDRAPADSALGRLSAGATAANVAAAMAGSLRAMRVIASNAS